jgi:hypothetical protein
MTTISPFKEGAAIQVAQGILRGVGPMGPRGYTGPPGPAGPQGIQGEQAVFEPVSAQYSRSSLFTVTNNGQWQTVPMTTTGYNVGNWTSLVTATGAVRITSEHINGIAVIVNPSVVVRPGSSGTESFRIEVGVFLDTAGVPFASNVFTHSNGATPSTFNTTFQYLLAAQGDLRVAVRVIGAAVSPEITFASMAIANTGGALGPPGPAGAKGDIGSSGPAGPPGNSNSGFATLDGLDSQGDSDALPTGTSKNSQGITLVSGSLRPALPAFINAVAADIQKRFVRRFATETEMNSASDKEVGQLAFLSSNNSLRVITSVGGTPTPATVAQVSMGTTDPPAGTYPAGLIYFKVSS